MEATTSHLNEQKHACLHQLVHKWIKANM